MKYNLKDKEADLSCKGPQASFTELNRMAVDVIVGLALVSKDRLVKAYDSLELTDKNKKDIIELAQFLKMHVSMKGGK